MTFCLSAAIYPYHPSPTNGREFVNHPHHFHPKGVPGKGKILTQLSLFWFEKLKHVIPTHFVTSNIDEMPEEVKQYKEQLEGRTMLVKKATVIPLEAIVRGYITGISGFH